MRKRSSDNDLRCTYCGSIIIDVIDGCDECGKGVGYTRDCDSGFSWGELNDIDNILESKRR